MTTNKTPCITTKLTAMSLGTLMLTIAGCGASGAVTAPDVPAGETIQVQDAWVKAADSGMSAAFGELRNTSGRDITVTAISSPASGSLELHETLDNESGRMVMQEKAGGFTIPAGGSLELEPGGNHIMLLGLAWPIVSGQAIEFTLEFSDRSTLDFTAPAKDYSGANESYDAGDDTAKSGHGTGAQPHDG